MKEQPQFFTLKLQNMRTVLLEQCYTVYRREVGVLLLFSQQRTKLCSSRGYALFRKFFSSDIIQLNQPDCLTNCDKYLYTSSNQTLQVRAGISFCKRVWTLYITLILKLVINSSYLLQENKYEKIQQINKKPYQEHVYTCLCQEDISTIFHVRIN